MVKIATTIDLDGPFFRHDPAKTFHQNVLVLLEAIAKEGEQDVVAKLRQGQSQRYPIGSAVKPNRVSAHARGRVHSLRGKHWRATAVVSVNNSGFSPRQGIALMAAASWVESQTHAFRRMTNRMRRAKALQRAELLKGINK